MTTLKTNNLFEMLSKGGSYSVFFHQAVCFQGVLDNDLYVKRKKKNPKNKNQLGKRLKEQSLVSLCCVQKRPEATGAAVVSESSTVPMCLLFPWWLSHPAAAQGGLPALPLRGLWRHEIAQWCSDFFSHRCGWSLQSRDSRHMHVVHQPETSMQTQGSKRNYEVS